MMGCKTEIFHKHAIYKYLMTLSTGEREIEIPGLIRPLSLQYKDSNACLWVECMPDLAPQKHRIISFMTGQEFNGPLARWDFLGTIQIQGMGRNTITFHYFLEK